MVYGIPEHQYYDEFLSVFLSVNSLGYTVDYLQ